MAMLHTIDTVADAQLHICQMSLVHHVFDNQKLVQMELAVLTSKAW